jgi:hypothetical protein
VNSWTFWDVPGWREDVRLQSFYKNAFGPVAAFELAAYKGGATEGSAYADRLRRSLEYLLEQQPASIEQWLSLSGFQFFSEGELYGFLLEVYNYFYGDQDHPPVPPHPDRRPPSDDDRFWSDWVEWDE